MKQLLSVLVLIMIVVGLVINQSLPADAAKGKKKGMSQEAITEIVTNVDELTRKVYRRELFTPEDADKLIALKLQLDEQMDVMSETDFAPLYYKIGNIYRLRGAKNDAISCYQTVLENFSQTAYGPKSKDILTEMGVEINIPDIKEENPNSANNTNETEKI